jgi:hypothetical protein
MSLLVWSFLLSQVRILEGEPERPTQLSASTLIGYVITLPRPNWRLLNCPLSFKVEEERL